MSKYIRTKGNTFIEFNYSNERVIDGNKYIVFVRILNDGSEEKYCVPERYIATQANTIEELCDGYYVDKNKEVFIEDEIYESGSDNRIQWLKPYLISCVDKGINVYAFIKTDKGLIYVAKMNEKGELELL